MGSSVSELWEVLSHATSWPIKGTRPRGAGPAADAALLEELLASSKDAAELAMITGHTLVVDGGWTIV